MIHQITFSPTGGTLRVAELIAQGMGTEKTVTELCVPEKELQYPEIKETDIALIALPVFAGRVPSLAVERLKRIKAHHAQCVIVAVYGNREYDDALLEMYDTVKDMGFHPLAAIGAIAEHSIARCYATGRPDKKDGETLTGFGRKIRKRQESAPTDNPLSIPGNRPYRNGNTGPYPEADERCNACGKCVRNCPVSAIPSDNPRTVNKDICISCMRCVSLCPTGARDIGAVKDMVTARLKPLATERKENVLFI